MYGTKYILSFTNNLAEFFEVYFEYLDYTGFSTPITGTNGSIILRNNTGDRSTLEPYIRGTECVLEVRVKHQDTLSIQDFLSTIANNIRITVYLDKKYDFAYYQGFVAVEDLSQPFMDPPYEISIRALDGLGLLKGLDLVDINNVKFSGNLSIIQWIAQIIYKTEQILPIRVYFNIFNPAFTGSVPFDSIFLNSTTFSEGDSFNVNSSDPSINNNALTADDCYTALEKIMRCFRCTLFQQDGTWHIVNLWEYSNPNGYSYVEYTLGSLSNVFLSNNCGSTITSNLIVRTSITDKQDNIKYSLNVGKKEILNLIQNDGRIDLQQPLKWLKLTYDYNQSQNKIINQDLQDVNISNILSSGTIQSNVIDINGSIFHGRSSSGNPNFFPMVYHNYSYYGWDHFDGVFSNLIAPNPYPNSPATTPGYIRTILDYSSYEYERFLVLNRGAAPTFFKSSCFSLDINDRVDISLNTRTMGADSHAADIIAYLLLTDTSGNNWALTNISGIIGFPHINPESTWVSVDSQFRNSSGNTPGIGYLFDSTSDTRNWANVTTGSNNSATTSVPASGTANLYLLNYAHPPNESWFKDIQITVIPFLNGTFNAIIGDYNYSSQHNNLSIKASKKETVEISDSPKRYFKGALQDMNGNLLPPTWQRKGYEAYDGNIVNGTFVPGLRFTQIMERLMFNNLDRTIQRIEGSFRGLIYWDNFQTHPHGLLNSYYFTDPTVLTNPTKKFRCTSYEKNLVTGQWTGVFVEVLNDQNDDGFAAPDIFVFNYVFK